jgi:hypothetical protein
MCWHILLVSIIFSKCEGIINNVFLGYVVDKSLVIDGKGWCCCVDKSYFDLK